MACIRLILFGFSSCSCLPAVSVDIILSFLSKTRQRLSYCVCLCVYTPSIWLFVRAPGFDLWDEYGLYRVHLWRKLMRQPPSNNTKGGPIQSPAAEQDVMHLAPGCGSAQNGNVQPRLRRHFIIRNSCKSDWTALKSQPLCISPALWRLRWNCFCIKGTERTGQIAAVMEDGCRLQSNRRRQSCFFPHSYEVSTLEVFFFSFLEVSWRAATLFPTTPFRSISISGMGLRLFLCLSPLVSVCTLAADRPRAFKQVVNQFRVPTFSADVSFIT